MLTSPTAAHQFLGNPVGIAPAPFSDQLVMCGYHQRLGSPLVNGTIQICWHPFIPKQKMSKVKIENQQWTFYIKEWTIPHGTLVKSCKSHIHPQKNLQHNPLNNLRAANPSLPPCLTPFQGNTPWGKSNAFHTPMMTLLFQDLALQNTPTGNYGGKRGIVNGNCVTKRLWFLGDNTHPTEKSVQTSSN